jgi:antitoxin component YwqK of YwqJK toxin-antitoxin module
VGQGSGNRQLPSVVNHFNSGPDFLNLRIMICRAGLFFLVLVFCPVILLAQGFTRMTYHDAAKRYIKEIYQVKDTISNVSQGRYVSFFLNGRVESKGQFVNNETTGVWEFYYETGNLKMRGILRQGSNYGVWEYFYENGNKSMEGTIDGKQKEGIWKIYYEGGELKETGEYSANKRTGVWTAFFEDGVKKAEIDYKDDFGKYTEYHHSGKIMAEGPKSGVRNVGHWRTYAEDGTLESEGEYSNGSKNGDWTYYYPSGKISSTRKYINDEPVGQWAYYYEDGKVSSKGEFVSGKKEGFWSSFHKDGSKRSEVTYKNGSGDYREYYPSGKLKVKGQIIDHKDEGRWEYYYEDGKLEGECEFDKGKGIYLGYYPNGSLQTKGQLENDMRVGTWELYEQDGQLTGYYKPFYEDKTLANDINALVTKSKVPAPIKRNVRRGFHYFSPRYPEYHSAIIQGNPALAFIGMMPFGIEFYNESRLGHEFSFDGIRDPFFTADAEVPVNKVFNRGYAISLKQKFYNPLKNGLWYFGHEIRFTDLGHFANVQFMGPSLSPVLMTASASEQRVEYGILTGRRLMQKRDADGFTIDAFIGFGIGYRNLSVDNHFESAFSSLSTSNLATTFRFGLNFGYSFSFDGSGRY